MGSPCLGPCEGPGGRGYTLEIDFDAYLHRFKCIMQCTRKLPSYRGGILRLPGVALVPGRWQPIGGAEDHTKETVQEKNCGRFAL